MSTLFLNIKEIGKTIVSKYVFIQFIIGLFCIFFALSVYPITRFRINSLRSICWSCRVLNSNIIICICIYLLKKLFLIQSIGNTSDLVNVCEKSNFFNSALDVYSLSNNNIVNIQRDFIILKEKSHSEKGVLLIKYTPAFDAFYYYFDYNKVVNDYYIVLEPSWAGACDPSFMLYWRNIPSKSVVVQVLEDKDQGFIDSLGGNFISIPIGSSDWTDSDLFDYNPNVSKEYDIIMVSNWGWRKNHRYLFKALQKINSKLNIVLIGFSWENRNLSDIRDEIIAYKLFHNIEILEGLSPSEVSAYLNKSKVYVLLSAKEGGNKSLVEALYSNVPVVLYNNFIGGVQKMINPETGIFSSFEDLYINLTYMINNYFKFTPRKWVTENSGSSISTIKLNMLLRKIAQDNKEVWVHDIREKVNAPNLKYKNYELSSVQNSEFIETYKKSC